MDESNNYKLKIDFLISNDTSLSHPTQNKFKPKAKKCKKCNKKRKIINEIHQICHKCYKIETIKLNENKVIDDFIKNTLNNCDINKAKLEFVPYDRFKDVEFIAEGGFSKIYKATWINGPLSNRWNKKKQESYRFGRM